MPWAPVLQASNFVSAVSGGWTVDGLTFNTRKELTIDATLIDDDLDNFVVEAMRTDDGDIGADATANGGDIRFTLKVGGTLLTYERELWSLAGGLATFVHHVEVPSVPSATDTVLYCYYNTSTGSPPDGDDGGAGNSWDANFKGVYHLSETGSGAVGEYRDSTSNGNHGRGGAGTGTRVPALVSAGKVDGAQDFDGSNDFIDLGSPASLTSGISGALTVEAWAMLDTLTSPGSILSHNEGGGYGILANYDSSLETWFYVNGAYRKSAILLSSLTINTWYHVVGTFDGSTTILYINAIAQPSVSASGTISNPAVAVGIGSNPDAVGDYNEPWKGLIDEVRISNIARSAPWIKASYNSQNGSLITWGAEETA